MKIVVDKTTLVSLLALSTCSATGGVPRSHPSLEVLAKFSPHFRCPYANDWVTKGPRQAAHDLGLLDATMTVSGSTQRSIRRRVQESVAGSCTYTNSWTNQPACLEFRGDSWSESTMGERCGAEEDSTLTIAAPCEVPTGLGGYCVVGEEGSIEATPLLLASGMDCATAQTTCQNFIRGTFSAGDGCMEGGTPAESQGTEAEGSPFTVGASSENVTCAIAPGAIGAAHQAGYSNGYSPNCEGTPAEGSPYMWPMAWRANVETKSLAFGSDDVVYHSKGNVHYRLDKNWKRQDWYYQKGVLRTIGQGPCEPEDQVADPGSAVMACRKDSEEYNTMIHRGSKMLFISWKNGTEVGSSDPSQIVNCTFLDIQVVGNIRNDWFMDDRGDSTDVQYLGDQHVFHDGMPRLVKQWRKKDFANQYFVMSVLANVKQDGIHWPMILNIPGEGFGDDFLQIYRNQTVATDEEDYRFLLDEALEGIGGECIQLESDGVGPPTETVVIPSNLEVDPNSWFHNVYTYSPVWEPPVDEEEEEPTASESNGMALTEEGDIMVESCYDSNEKAVHLSVQFSNLEMVGDDFPWMALGYRETDECLMIPRGGGDTELIMLAAKAGEQDVGAHFTLLPPLARNNDADAISSIYDNMVPLNEKEGFSDVTLQIPGASSLVTKSANEGVEDTVMLQFKQSMPEAPEVMHLIYAIGSTPEIGYHRTRKCFDIAEFPACPTDESTGGETKSVGEAAPVASASSAGRTTFLASLFIALFALLF